MTEFALKITKNEHNGNYIDVDTKITHEVEIITDGTLCNCYFLMKILKFLKDSHFFKISGLDFDSFYSYSISRSKTLAMYIFPYFTKK
jgi:hypothetical protein